MMTTCFSYIINTLIDDAAHVIQLQYPMEYKLYAHIATLCMSINLHTVRYTSINDLTFHLLHVCMQLFIKCHK